MDARPLLSLIALVASALAPGIQAQSCERLSKLASPTVSITVAKTIDTGVFTLNGSTTTIPHLPAFCRVVAIIKPTADSDIETEVWLPVADWKGKFLAIGSGGWGGSIAHDEMADALRRGYAPALPMMAILAAAPVSSLVTRRSSSTSPTVLSTR